MAKPPPDTAALEARVSTLEAQTAALETRVTALEQAAVVPPEPPPALLTKDFNAAVELGGCGCDDPTDPNSCWAAAIEWRNFVVANPGATLKMAKGNATYAFNLSVLIVSDPKGSSGAYPDTYLIPSCTIDAEPGTTVDNFNAVGTYGQFAGNINGSAGSGAFIATAHARDTTVTLLNAAEAADFTVGRWLAVCGIATQSLGYPPNFQHVEYHQVTGIAGAVLTLDAPLRKSYSQTWPNNIDEVTVGGAACVHRMGSNWDTTQTVRNIRALHSSVDGTIIGCVAQPIRKITLENFIFDEVGFSPTVCQEAIFVNVSMLNAGGEMDKMIERVIYDHCPLKQLNIQSSAPNDLIVRNGCDIANGFPAGTGQNLTIEDSTVGGVFHTGTGFGRCGDLVINNSTMPPFLMATHGIVPDLMACFEYLGGGLWLFSSTDYVRAMNFEQAVCPGYQYAFAYATGDAVIYPDGGGEPIYFCVTDIRDATAPGTYKYYMQTDMPYALGELPTPIYLGRPWNTFQAIPYTSITIDGVAQVGGFAATQVCPCLIA